MSSLALRRLILGSARLALRLCGLLLLIRAVAHASDAAPRLLLASFSAAASCSCSRSILRARRGSWRSSSVRRYLLLLR